MFPLEIAQLERTQEDQQLAHLFRIGEGGMMLDVWRFEQSAQVWRQIVHFVGWRRAAADAASA